MARIFPNALARPIQANRPFPQPGATPPAPVHTQSPPISEPSGHPAPPTVAVADSHYVTSNCAATLTFATTDAAGRVLAPQPGIRNPESGWFGVERLTIETDTGGVDGILVEIKYRDNPITNGFVPVGAVTRSVNRRFETGAAKSVASFDFSKPLWLAPSEYLTVNVQNTLVSGASGLTNVNMCAHGKRVFTEPSEVWLPYLSAYLGPVYTDNTGNAISDQSAAGAQLGNPFDVPLLVERIFGRVLTASAAAGPFNDNDPSPIWLTYLLRISDQEDHFWTPFPTPLPLVFKTIDRAWNVNVNLDPKGFLRAEFEGTANVTSLGFSRAAIGLAGYRRIA